MSSFLDLPDELILEVLSYTEIAELLKCGQVSKRIRTISDDNSLFQTVDLSNKYVKTDLLAAVLNKGCKSLNLSDSSIWGRVSLIHNSRLTVWGNIILIQNPRLRKLDITNCRASTYNTIEELLASCHSLQILSLKGLQLTSRMVTSICQNSQTLQVLNLYYSYDEEEWYREIIKTCQEMKKFGFILERSKAEKTKEQSKLYLIKYTLFFLKTEETCIVSDRHLILDPELLSRCWPKKLASKN